MDTNDDRDQEVIGSLRLSLSCSLRPWDPDDYWCEIEGPIVAARDDDTEESVGHVKLVIIKMAEALDDHVSQFDIFDGYSEDLKDVYEAIFADGEPRSELRIECTPCDILYVESLKLEPKYVGSKLFSQALEAASSMFASQGLVVSYMGTLDQGTYEWTHCGFQAVPGTEVVFRDNLRVRRDGKAC